MKPEAGDMDRSDGLGGEAIRCPSCGGPVSSVDGDLYCVACGWSGPREADQEVYDRSKADPYDSAHGLDR